MIVLLSNHALSKLNRLIGNSARFNNIADSATMCSIKGEQLMSALKEFGIESLSELNVTFEKSVADRNPSLQYQAAVSQ